jgi:hypothetical protein
LHSAIGVVVARIIGLLPNSLSLRTLVALRVLESGVLEVVRTVGITRIVARDLVAIEDTLNRGYDDKDVWKLQLRHRDGRISIEHFAGTAAFLAAVCAVNPDVEITGPWPQAAL